MTKQKDTKPKATSLPKNQEKIELEQKNAELQDKLARSLADYSNLEKRIESQRQLFVTLTTTAIVSKMVDILDDLNLTQSHLKDQGLQMTIDKFLNVLKSEGLEEVEAEGKEFDPQFMECIEVADGVQNQVLAVKKKGYKLNGHVIRPAQVVVGNNN
jgi:molecular chaperone GrpE